jgi:hypothetical protein
MRCPKCHFENEEQAAECLKCGIVFAKFAQHEAMVSAREQRAQECREQVGELRQELTYRVLAIPAALIAARIMVGIAPAFIRIIAMFVHESGHAVTAWLCGFWATPGLWFTPISDERNFAITLFFIVVFGFGVYGSWTTDRRALAGLCAAALLLEIIGRLLPARQAEALFTFGGDGGSLVLGTLLMMTVYARRDGALRANSLQWGFLGIGAAAFIDAFTSWTGKEEDIPFGVQEGTLSDPSALVQTYGWTIQLMIQRYIRLAEICLIALTIVYICGIVQTRAEVNRGGAYLNYYRRRN